MLTLSILWKKCGIFILSQSILSIGILLLMIGIVRKLAMTLGKEWYLLCKWMEAKDGSFGFDFTAIYDVVSLHDKLSYTLEDGRKVITLFSVEDGGIKVTTSFEAEDQNPLDMQKAGWQAILNNFKSYTETN